MGNTGQDGSGSEDLSDNDAAQFFRTGSAEHGYVLKSVGLLISTPGGRLELTTSLTVRLHDGDNNSTVGTLDKPRRVRGPAAGQVNTFDAPGDGLELQRNKRYYVYLDSESPNLDISVRRTASNGEDEGKAEGWSIDDSYLYRAYNRISGNHSSSTDSLQIEIRGHPITRNPPTAMDGRVQATEDTPFAFAASHFNFSDVDANDTLNGVTVVDPPARGILALVEPGTEGTAVTAGQAVTRADIDAGKLVWTPPAHAHGEGYTSFTFKVTDRQGTSSSTHTMTIDVAAVNDTAEGRPGISGHTKRRTLTVLMNDIADADGLPDTFPYDYEIQWQRVNPDDTTDVTDISGATRRTYLLQTADLDMKARVRVRFTDDEGSSEELFSELWPKTGNIVLNPNVPATGAPDVSGTPVVGQTLSVDLGDIADTEGLPATFPDDYTFQWLRVDADGTSNEREIEGATSRTYELQVADKRKKVRARGPLPRRRGVPRAAHQRPVSGDRHHRPGPQHRRGRPAGDLGHARGRPDPHRGQGHHHGRRRHRPGRRRRRRLRLHLAVAARRPRRPDQSDRHRGGDRAHLRCSGPPTRARRSGCGPTSPTIAAISSTGPASPIRRPARSSRPTWPRPAGPRSRAPPPLARR